MANCNVCGTDAGYLSSICGDCRATLPPQPGNVKSTASSNRNPLRIDPSERVSGGSKAKLFLVGAAVLIAVLVLIGLVGGNSSTDQINTAKELVNRQIASDISLEFDDSSIQLHDPGGNLFYVCGRATLNSPGGSRISLNNVTQRFITTVNRSSHAGLTLFDGSSSLDGMADFQLQWIAKCE
jgi:hypothetical protein